MAVYIEFLDVAGHPNPVLIKCTKRLLNSSDAILITKWVKQRTISSLRDYVSLKAECAYHSTHYMRRWMLAIDHTIEALEASLAIVVYRI